MLSVVARYQRQYFVNEKSSTSLTISIPDSAVAVALETTPSFDHQTSDENQYRILKLSRRRDEAVVRVAKKLRR